MTDTLRPDANDAEPPGGHRSAMQAAQSAALLRMKRIALGLLAGAGVLYLLATWLAGRHPAWGYVAAFSEAAMVGAIADWFAVVALFRHPLGLPIPHTAIIPSNKDRIGENLAAFICANFLGTQQVLAKIRRFGLATRLADWLADPQRAARLTAHFAATLRYVLGVLDDERVRGFFRSTVLEQLARLDAALLAGHLLAALTADRRHQAVLDALLRKLAAVLDDEALKARLADIIATEVKYLKVIGLDTVAGRYATTKIVAGITRLAGEMADDPAHPLRLEFDAWVDGFALRLQQDEALRRQVGTLQCDLLASPALAGYLQGLWGDLVAWVRTDLGRDGDQSVLRERTLAGVRLVGEKLRTDERMKAWIDEQLVAAAPRWIERYREDIRLYIVARVGDWNAAEMTRELERNIGRDLQFIRINGTLVGGLAGLAIHAATQWLRLL